MSSPKVELVLAFSESEHYLGDCFFESRQSVELEWAFLESEHHLGDCFFESGKAMELAWAYPDSEYVKNSQGSITTPSTVYLIMVEDFE
jgi:hypothetical protein